MPSKNETVRNFGNDCAAMQQTQMAGQSGRGQMNRHKWQDTNGRTTNGRTSTADQKARPCLQCNDMHVSAKIRSTDAPGVMRNLLMTIAGHC